MTVNPQPDVVSDTRSENIWRTKGFEAFREGEFGNGGHNLYVSRAGVLQRIHHHDVDADGYLDLLFCNSQNHWEVPPSYEYRWNGSDLEQIPIAVRGASAAAIGDLNGDGIPDVVAGLWYNGIGFDVNATVFYGQACGHAAHASDPRWGERAMQVLPAPFCTAVAIGDFTGEGKPAVAMGCAKFLRVFSQSDLGLTMKSYRDLPVAAEMLCAADLDGDGADELLVRFRSGRVRIYWGGGQGVLTENFTDVDVPGDTLPPETPPVNDGEFPSVEWVEEPFPQVRVVSINNVPHVFVARESAAWLVPVEGQRTLGEPVKISCAHAMSISFADLDGDGHNDLVLACRDGDRNSESSYIFWGDNPDGWRQQPTRLPSDRASDVAVGDFDGDGAIEVVISQSYDDDWFTRSSPIYRLHGRTPVLWKEVETHDARRVFAVPHPHGRGDSLVVINRQGRNRVGNVPATIYMGGADGFSADRSIQLPGWGSTVGVMADFNDDGVCDVALANTAENSIDRDPGSYVYLQSLDGFPASPTQVLPTTRAHGIACADLNRDGYLDLIFAGFTNDEVLIFSGGPDGFDVDNPVRFKTELDGRVYNQHRFFHLADLNHDGWLDLVLPLCDADHSLILWGGPDGFSMERSQKLSIWHAISARAADLSGNGYLDLIISSHMPSTDGPSDAFVHIYWNSEDGLREDRKTLLPCFAGNSMSIADFNNDGNLDLFVGSYQMSWKKRDCESFIYWNREGRGFSSTDFTRLFTHSASGDIAADFNEDGWVDLAVANHKEYGDHSAHSQVWWNGPDGFEEKNITWLPTHGPHGMVTPGPGNQLDRGPEEYYTSAPYFLGGERMAAHIDWDAELAAKTWVHAQVRFADSHDRLDRNPWLGPDGAGTWFTAGSDIPSATHPGDAQWMQYRLALGATNSGSSPRVREVLVQLAEK